MAFTAIDNFSGTTQKIIHAKVSSIEVANICAPSGNSKLEIKRSSIFVCCYIHICDHTCEKGPCRASFQNRVITAIGNSRL